MKVLCLHIPRRAPSDAAAIYETTWSLTNARFFMHQLDDLSETTTEPVSCEFYSSSNIVYACLAGGERILDRLTVGLYAWMPDCQVREVEDYTYNVDDRTVVVGGDIRLARLDVLPIQNYMAFSSNSLQPIVALLSHLPDGDRLLIQVIVRPIPETAWHHFSLARGRARYRFNQLFNPRTYLKRGLNTKTAELMREKCQRRMLYTNYRITAFSQLPTKTGAAAQAATVMRLTQHVKNIASAVQQFNTTDENQLVLGKIYSGASHLKTVQERRFIRPYRLSSIEATTLYHPPSLFVLPNTAQVLSKKQAPPRNLPYNQEDPQICFFGHTNFRDQAVPFGIKRFDRRRHLYISGKSGSGKSCLVQLLVRNDIENGFGCAVLDPHGDLVDDILNLVPKHRVKDIVLFDPSDVHFPPCFNPMNPVRPELKTRVTLSFLDTFRRAFGSEWSSKMDHVLRYAMMGLVNIPGSSIVSLRRMLSDETFRTEIVRRSSDESVKRFWLREFVQRRKEFEEGPISQLLNRLDDLLATDMMRNILGQSMNLFDFREFMDTRKIVLLKISKGVLGGENATLLGSLAVWKIYEAAMSRADISAESRQDFYFYIDEFQNFATESFGEILSESRKYKLCLTLANQHLGQLSQSIRKTVLGNVANTLCFGVGADDAAILGPEFRPRFAQEDLINLALREFALKMSIDGEVQEAFSGRTLDVQYLPEADNCAQECLTQSRSKYCVPIEQAQESVEQMGDLPDLDEVEAN